VSLIENMNMQIGTSKDSESLREKLSVFSNFKTKIMVIIIIILFLKDFKLKIILISLQKKQTNS
jgi:hypothetical protein